MKGRLFSQFLLIDLVILCLMLLAGAVLTNPLQASNTLTSPIQALALPVCPAAEALFPPNPAFIRAEDPVLYHWLGEPENTTVREVLIYDVGRADWGTTGTPLIGSGYGEGFHWIGFAAVFTANPASPPGSGQAFIRLDDAAAQPGTYNWLAIFYDSALQPICRSVPYWLNVRSAPSGSGDGSIPTLPAAQPVFIPTNTATYTTATPSNTPPPTNTLLP